MKDNFDLRKYLIENKMTENSRGSKRHHLTESVVLNTKILSEAEYRDQDLDLDQLDDEDFDPQEALAAYDAAMQDMDGEGVVFEDPENLNDKELDECGDMSMELDEASYVDDDDDFARDLDFTAGDDLAARIGGRQAKQAATSAISDEYSDETPKRGPNKDSDDPDAPPARGGKFKPGDWVRELKSYGYDLDWENIDFAMDDDELNTYLGNFNRPARAAEFLADHLRSAQKEVNWGPRKKMYFILKTDGYYGTANFLGAMNQTRYIATIYKNEENAKKYAIEN